MMLSRYEDDVAWMVVVEGGRARRSDVGILHAFAAALGFLGSAPRLIHVLESSFLKSEWRCMAFLFLINCKPRTMDRFELVAVTRNSQCAVPDLRLGTSDLHHRDVDARYEIQAVEAARRHLLCRHTFM
jgi:hypothetical protein